MATTVPNASTAAVRVFPPRNAIAVLLISTPLTRRQEVSRVYTARWVTTLWVGKHRVSLVPLAVPNVTQRVASVASTTMDTPCLLKVQ